MFFALEQRAARRRPGVALGVKFASWAYQVIGDYGRNFGRPLAILAFLTLLAFPAAYRGISLAAGVDPTLRVIPFAIQQVVRPFEVWSSRYDPGADAAWFLNLRSGRVSALLLSVAALQSLVSIGLLALVLVALRRQFKLD